MVLFVTSLSRFVRGISLIAFVQRLTELNRTESHDTHFPTGKLN